MKRMILAVFALLVLFPVTAAPTDAGTVDYGSGSLGNWATYSHCDTGCRGVNTATGRYVYSDSWDIADVGVIGDSITARGWGDLYALITANGRRMAVNFWSARPTAPAVDWLVQRVQAGKRIPRTLVMAVGANDVYAPFAMQAQIARLLKAVPGVKVYMVDVQVARPAYALADQRNSGIVNKAIWQGCTGDCGVISWASFFAAYPRRLTMYLTSDGVHPIVGVGTRAWAALIAASVKETVS